MSSLQAPSGDSITASDPQGSFTVYHGVVVPARSCMTGDLREGLAEYGLKFGPSEIVARGSAFAVSDLWGPRGTWICLDKPDLEMQTTQITYITRYEFKYTHSEQGILEVVFADKETEKPYNLKKQVTFGQALLNVYEFPQASWGTGLVSEVGSSLHPAFIADSIRLPCPCQADVRSEGMSILRRRILRWLSIILDRVAGENPIFAKRK